MTQSASASAPVELQKEEDEGSRGYSEDGDVTSKISASSRSSEVVLILESVDCGGGGGGGVWRRKPNTSSNYNYIGETGPGLGMMSVEGWCRGNGSCLISGGNTQDDGFKMNRPRRLSLPSLCLAVSYSVPLKDAVTVDPIQFRKTHTRRWETLPSGESESFSQFPQGVRVTWFTVNCKWNKRR